MQRVLARLLREQRIEDVVVEQRGVPDG